ncbi:virulence factor MviM [Paenibacillus dendritiformis]|uniref:Gfo/Idh/MocA family protein n=1 Tax=Paenibacillus dendritiformis TaxID=130049 RepID=UPI001B2BEDC6|nr:Gfo/Idh/MocA family oxidoreductase [Paenibacillus dendritiformis]GIO71970.1 virulence factor MviM [Paenibacillus dendritiformis]
MRVPRIGIVGLGSIAQKAYLPVLSRAEKWTLAGAYTPNEAKRLAVCAQHRIAPYSSIGRLAEECDAMFVHSSTASHYEIVAELLRRGIDVYVDKPLAATLGQAEALAELSERLGRTLMVGFNRRFAPRYEVLASEAEHASWIRIEKHRAGKVKPVPYLDTLLDDYIHVIDLVRHFSRASGEALRWTGRVHINSQGHLLDVHHLFAPASGKGPPIFAAMHRQAGIDVELVERIGPGATHRVRNLSELTVEENGASRIESAGSWTSVAKIRGFEDAVLHFIGCITHGGRPLTDGREACETQALVHALAAEAVVADEE